MSAFREPRITVLDTAGERCAVRLTIKAERNVLGHTIVAYSRGWQSPAVARGPGRPAVGFITGDDRALTPASLSRYSIDDFCPSRSTEKSEDFLEADTDNGFESVASCDPLPVSGIFFSSPIWPRRQESRPLASSGQIASSFPLRTQKKRSCNIVVMSP